MTTTLRIVFTKRAADQAERALQWWREHRPAAPDLLEQELRDVLSLVATAPSLGAVARDGRLGEVRRVLLRRTRYYVFYRAQISKGDLEVLAVWHARRRPHVPSA